MPQGRITQRFRKDWLWDKVHKDLGMTDSRTNYTKIEERLAQGRITQSFKEEWSAWPPVSQFIFSVPREADWTAVCDENTTVNECTIYPSNSDN